MIELKNLTKSYKDADKELIVLNDFSANFSGAKSHALLGQSGVGKSTLLHLIAGLVKPTSGNVIINNTEVNLLKGDKLSDFRGTNIGFVYQFHHLLPEFSALENVAMPLIINGVNQKEALNTASEILAKVNLLDREKHMPGQLSGGEQQRVAIARAVAIKPKVILADEPTGNLDPKTSLVVLELLLKLCSDNGSTLLVVTHQSDLSSYFDYSYELRKDSKLVELKKE
jgi:lipoprotein-releasing system ATP-binding protein